jgi:hypothetical protein
MLQGNTFKPKTTTTKPFSPKQVGVGNDKLSALSFPSC